VSLPPYPQYHDNGSRWLGPLPAGWNLVPLKAVVANIESGVSVNADDRPAVAGELGVLKTSCVYTGAFDISQNKAVVAADLARVACPVRQGSLIVSRMNTPDLVGAAGLVLDAQPNIFLPDRLWQVTLKDAVPAFAHYWSASQAYRGQVQAACSGTSSSMQNLSQGQFLSFDFPLASIAEQRAIAAFLDRECGKIDGLVAEQERLIALLKEKRQAVISQAVTKGLDPAAPMKDSGIEWLGPVPAHWGIRPIRAIYRFVKRQERADLDVLSVYRDYGVIPKASREDNINKTPEDLSLYQTVKPLDIVVNKMKAWQGSLGVSNLLGITSPDYAVFEPTQPVEAGYLNFLLRCSLLPGTYRTISNGIRPDQWRLEPDKFRELRIPYPPLAEQRRIADVITAQTSRHEALTTEAERAIALLKERRAALISAAVTGKIDVRDLAAPAAAKAA
jgi:type I restriction enzyme S subunit